MKENLELMKAEHQLTGCAHAYQGYDIISLIEDMGLGLEEWEALRDNASWLPKELREEIDEYFDNR